MKHIIGLMAMLLPILCGAQSPPVRALTIGDTVPDIVFNHVINYKDTTARLSDFKGKLVILDFWASWCSSCIIGFPKADSIQTQFPNEVQIILLNPKISMDGLIQVNKTLDKVRAIGIAIKMPIVVFDTLASAYFPFRLFPHYVWIGPDRIVKAITGRREFNTHNVELILRGESNPLPLKDDRQHKHLTKSN